MEKELGVTAEMKVGPTGSFFVDVDGRVVIEKRMLGFPDEDEIVAAVGKALGPR